MLPTTAGWHIMGAQQNECMCACAGTTEPLVYMIVHYHASDAEQWARKLPADAHMQFQQLPEDEPCAIYHVNACQVQCTQPQLGALFHPHAIPEDELDDLCIAWLHLHEACPCKSYGPGANKPKPKRGRKSERGPDPGVDEPKPKRGRKSKRGPDTEFMSQGFVFCAHRKGEVTTYFRNTHDMNLQMALYDKCEELGGRVATHCRYAPCLHG